MTYRQPIVQSPYTGMGMQQPVVQSPYSGMPYSQPYYPNYPSQPQNVKIVNQGNILKTPTPTPADYHIENLIHNQMNSLKELFERAEKIKNSRNAFESPFEVRWRSSSNPFPSFWKFESEQNFNFHENFASEFSVQPDASMNINYQKINEPRIQPNISQIQPNSTPLQNSPAYSSNVIPTQRSQSPQVATNFIPQRQPSPEIVVNNINNIPPKNIMQPPTNYSNGIPPNIINTNTNPIQRNMSDFDGNFSNNINSVPINNYNNPINAANMNNAAPNPGYNYNAGMNPSYNPNGYVQNNYNDPNNYSNAPYNNYSGYGNANGNMYNNYKSNYNYNNQNYRKTGYKPNSNPNKKHNSRKRSRGGSSQFTYKPDQAQE